MTRASARIVQETHDEAPETVLDVRFGAKHWEILEAIEASTPRFFDIEGALRSAKTWTILIALRRDVEHYPGIKIAIARWTEGDLNQKLIPDWRNVCALMHVAHGVWNAKESSYDFPNGSRVYCVHLKTSQKDNRYGPVRGLTVAKFYIDQLEEVPEDVYNEAALRLSQPGFPQQMIVSPNPVPETHWIAIRFPANNSRPQHQYIDLAMRDNAHNLDPATIEAAELLYPVGHPLRRVKIEGRRGLDVRGKPVYGDAFVRTRHQRALDVMPQLPLCESYDYGYHHPCVIWYQYAPWGWLRILGGVMGTDLHLDAFLPIVERYRAQWFPHRLRLEATCDPAGASANSQGLRGTPVGLLRSWYAEHGERDEFGRFVTPTFRSDANQPERRYAANQMVATYMRRLVNGDEAFLVDPERWVVAGLGEERHDSFFVDGLEAGYVLEDEARHSGKLGTFHVPKKDGWFEHPMNALEYAVIAHVQELPLRGERAAQVQLKHGERATRAEQRAELRALRAAQRDKDPYDEPQWRRRGMNSTSRGGY